jgi:hypothetical protein
VKEKYMPAAKSPVQKLLELAGQFVTKQKGVWDHDDWEAFLTKAGSLGVPVDDESKRNLGNILEAAKYFHATMPPPPKKKAASRKKTAAKKRARK